MAEWTLTGSRFGYRNDENVLVIHKRGDKVELNPEQEQRLRAGEPGSPFQKPGDEDEAPELVEVAVANEATKPSEDGTAAVSGARNRKVPAGRAPVAESEEDDKDAGPVPAPTTSTRIVKK
jgi:hypothetical protein